MLKVAMISRSTLFTIKGGDTVQITETAKQLSLIGVEVDIKLTDEPIAYEKYDLLHFFNIIRPADILFHIKRSGLPYVVSTILIDYSQYDKFQRKGISGFLFRYLSADSIEYLKTVARWVLGKDKLMSFSYLWKGQNNSIRYILGNASCILPNSSLEYQRIKYRYQYEKEYVIVPNGIDELLFHYDQSVNKDPQLVICAARIEGIKNQLNLIKALNGTKFQLFLIGSAAPNQTSYLNECKKIADKNIHFINNISQQELLGYYAKAKVHVLPSWFETTGLSSLEAAAMGCNIVISTYGDAKEYFEESAFYCDPGNSSSILSAIEKASSSGENENLRNVKLKKYTWQQAAYYTYKAYKKSISIL
jgi:glycosyltransferase involved in cell wall biosynthesis